MVVVPSVVEANGDARREPTTATSQRVFKKCVVFATRKPSRKSTRAILFEQNLAGALFC